MSGENTTSDGGGGGGESSIDELQAEIEQLKQRIADERRKLCDKTADLVAESIEPIVGLNIKVRNNKCLSQFELKVLKNNSCLYYTHPNHISGPEESQGSQREGPLPGLVHRQAPPRLLLAGSSQNRTSQSRNL